MSKHFGKTWWGQQWLNSLSNIDSNRLPRGSAYAHKGSVVSISIEGNKIKGKVKGSRPIPYKVQITIPHMLQNKKALANMTVATGENWIEAIMS